MRIPSKPPSIENIFSVLKPGDFSGKERTTALIEYVGKCEVGYWPWDKVRMAASAAGVDAEVAWAVIKIGRLSRYRQLPLVGADGQPTGFNVPDRVQHELMLIDQQTAGKFLSDDEAPLPHPQQRERFIVGALREEAIASSMLEGAATTRRDAKKLLLSGRTPKTNGERMVVNNYQAIMFMRENKKTPLSREFLLELQTILTKDTLDGDEGVGRLRRDDDNITVVDHRDNEVMHVPPPASELDERLERLCRFANQPPEGKPFIHPMIRACVLHFQIGFDHPFCDGNGRTARALFYWSMLRQGYWLFEYLPISRLIYRSPAKYVRAFLHCETDDFDITYFLTYKAELIGRARKELREYLRGKQARLAEARRMFKKDRRLNHRQQEVALLGARDPDRVFTIAEHQDRFAVSYGTARKDLTELEKLGYLTLEVHSKRFDFYPSASLLKSDVE